MNLKKHIAGFPAQPGVYLFKDMRGHVLYVGKSVNLKNRVASYWQHFSSLGEKTKRLVTETALIDYVLVESEIEALLLESSLIKKHLPRFNQRSKDDKTPLYIRFTKEELPRVVTARLNEQKPGDLLFGPFPAGKTVKDVLRLLRKIFPYCSCRKNKGRPCLYAHLGLCRPSPREIAKLPANMQDREKKTYLKNIRNLTRFLKGKRKSLIISLKREMRQKAKAFLFEEAALLRDQIQGLEFITQSFRPPRYYLANPNLLVDQRRKELVDLKNQLKKSGLLLAGIPTRIEAFDISNLSGQQATGSMITFLNGEPEKKLYRRFRINPSSTSSPRPRPRSAEGGQRDREKGKRDDSAMMAEILKRRLKHHDWGFSDLMVIDGGKPQVAACKKVLLKQNLIIPLIGLAKRKEEVIIHAEKGFSTLKIPRESPALHLIQRIRDEAHRFALAYHRHLRRKLID